MSSPSRMDLREELTALAETQTFSPDPSAWDRGRRARRTSRIGGAAAALAVVALVVGIGAVAVRPDADAPQPAEVPGGALPSRIPSTEPNPLSGLAIGRASVAYVDENSMPVLVDAATGKAHHAVLPDFPTQQVFETYDYRTGPWLALSPDGTRLAYPTAVVYDGGRSELSVQTAWYRVVDLTTGDSELVDLLPGRSWTPRAMSWTTDGRIAVDVFGEPTSKPTRNNPPPTETWTIDPATGDASTSPFTGIAAPGGGISAPLQEDEELVTAVRFETSSSTDPVSDLPADRYPDGAVVQPIGWVEPDVLVASIDPPPSDVTEHPRLVLVASPGREGPDVDFHELLPRLPPNLGLSIAVDLVPDLTGDPDQELTKDFTAASDSQADAGRVPLIAGGVMALLAGLVFIRTMARRA